MTILFLLSVCLNIFLCFCCYHLTIEYQTERMINEAVKEIVEEILKEKEEGKKE